MSFLSGPEILRQIERGKIIIDPFSPSQVNPNSYDLRLGNELKTYATNILDPRMSEGTYSHIIWDGYPLQPGYGYLATTIERTYCEGFVPVINGKSSLGRLFLSIHQTAGFGDDGFEGQWTLELVAMAKPVRIYPGMRICQIAFMPIVGERLPYQGKYQNQEGPVESRSWIRE